MKPLRFLALSIALLIFSFSAAQATPRQDVIAGPMTATLIDVYDGDTVNVKVRVWIGSEVETSLRIAGIDAPEMKGKCPAERAKAQEAREEIIRLLKNNAIRIYNVRLEKYAGRVLAEVQNKDGVDIAKHMIDKGLARPYQGQKRQPWCEAAEIDTMKKKG